MKLSDLVGEHLFQGIETGIMRVKDIWTDDCNYVKFRMDGITYLAVEDPDDGWRSYMRELRVVDGECRYKLPDIPIICKESEEYFDDVLFFIDKENCGTFLEIGTKDVGDWYPCCVMNYMPEALSCNVEHYSD